jgi:DNA-binding transcriptional LysR family regulator
MELRQLRYAIAVAKERSFTAAGARLNVSQSALSEQVAQLEREVGLKLFQRTKRGVEPTESGRAFLADAERVIADVLSLSDTARRLRGAPSDTLAIGMGSGMAQIFIPNLFGALERLGPVQLQILTAPTKNIFNDLYEERIDAGIAIESDPERIPAGIVLERLTEVEMALIVPRAHRLARSRKPVPVSELADEPMIMSELTVGYGQVVQSMFADAGLRPNVLAVADNIETMKVIIQVGAGVAMVPKASVANEITLGEIRALDVVPHRRVAFGLFRRRHPLSQLKEGALGAIRDLLRGSLGGI